MESFSVLVSAVKHVQEVLNQPLLDFYTRQNPSLLIEPYEMEEATFYAVLKEHVRPVTFLRGQYQTADPAVAAALLLFDRNFVPDPPDKDRKQVVAGDWFKRLEAVLEKFGAVKVEPEPGPVEPVTSPPDVIPEGDDVRDIFGAQLGNVLAAAGYPTGTSLRALRDPALSDERAALGQIKGIGEARLKRVLEYIES